MELAQSLRPIIHSHHLQHLESNIDKALSVITELWGAPEELVARALNMELQIINNQGKYHLDLEKELLERNMDGVKRIIGTRDEGFELTLRDSLHERTIGEFFRFGFKDSSEIPHFDEAMEYLKKLHECESEAEMIEIPQVPDEKMKELAEAVQKRYFRWTKEKFYRAKHAKHLIGPELNKPINDFYEKYGEEISNGLSALIQTKKKLTHAAVRKIMQAKNKLYVELDQADYRSVDIEQDEFLEPEHFHDMKKKNWTQADMEGDPDTDLALQSFDPHHYSAYHVHKKDQVRNLETLIESEDPFQKINIYKRKVLLEIIKLQKYIENEPQVMKLLAQMNYDHKKSLHDLATEISAGEPSEYTKIVSKYKDVFSKFEETSVYQGGTLKRKFDDLMKLMNDSYRQNHELGKEVFQEIVEDLAQAKHSERSLLKFKVKNGWTLDFNELNTLYNTKIASINQYRELKDSLDKFRKADKPQGNKLNAMLLSISKKFQKAENQAVPLCSVIEELKLQGAENQIVQFLQKLNRQKFMYSERKVGYRVWLEEEARKILSEMQPGQALEYIVRCVKAIKPRGNTQTLNSCLKQQWPNLGAKTSKDQFLRFVEWIGGLKAFLERDPRTNSSDMGLYLKKLRKALNVGAAKLEGDAHSLEQINRFQLKYEVDSGILQTLEKPMSDADIEKKAIDKEGVKAVLEKCGLEVLASNVDVVSMSGLATLVKDKEMKECLESLVESVNSDLAAVSHKTRQRLTIGEYLNSFKNTLLDWQSQNLPKYLGKLQLRAEVTRGDLMEANRAQIFQKLATLKNKTDLKFKNQFQNQLYREMLLTEEESDYRVKIEQMLTNYLQIRHQIAQGQREYQSTIKTSQERQQFADFLGKTIIQELSLDIDSKFDFQHKLSYDNLVKNKEKEEFEKKRYGLPELAKDEFLGISFEEQKQKEGELFHGKHELASGMHDDVGFDSIPQNLDSRQDIEIIPEEEELGRYKNFRNYTLGVKEGAQPHFSAAKKSKSAFQSWLKEYYLSVRKSLKNAKEVDQFLREYFTQKAGRYCGPPQVRRDVLEEKYDNYWFDGADQRFAQDRQFQDSGNSLRALYEKRRNIHRMEDAPTIKGQDWGTMLKLDVETAKALYGESVGLPEDLRTLSHKKGKDASLEELATVRPTRTMLNPYKCPQEWLNEVIDQRVREVFEGRVKVERFLTKNELIGFDKEVVVELSFENMRRSVMKFFKAQLSELKAVREALRSTNDFEQIQAEYDINDEKYLKNQTYYDEAKNPDLYFHQLAYKLTKQRREQIQAQDLPKVPKVIEYELTQLDRMILEDMKRRLKDPPKQIHEEDYEVKPVLKPKKYTEVQYLSSKEQLALQREMIVGKAKKANEGKEAGKAIQVLEKMMDAVERKEVDDSAEAQAALKGFFDEIYK